MDNNFWNVDWWKKEPEVGCGLRNFDVTGKV